MSTQSSWYTPQFHGLDTSDPLDVRRRPVLQHAGEFVFYLVSDWKGWVDRRVENVAFLDTITVTRQVSVDLTVPRLATPFFSARGAPLYLIPLAFHVKRRLIGFDLCDEVGRSLPLVAKRQNGPLAAAVLLAAARAWAGAGLPGGVGKTPPDQLLSDIWTIATDPPPIARETWTAIGRPQTDDPIERLWRQALVESEEFMTLASDLARNFLLLTWLAVDPGERRIVKFSYVEPSDIPYTGARRRLLRTRTQEDDREPLVPAMDHLPSSAPVARIQVDASVTSSGSGRSTQPPSITYHVTGANRRFGCITDKSGSAIVQVPLGNYTVAEAGVPVGLLPTSPVMQVKLSTPGETQPAEFTYKRAPAARPDDRSLPPLGLRAKVLRLLGMRPKRVLFFTPAIGQGNSYHFELAVADGLQATLAELVDSASYTVAGRRVVVSGSADRTSLSPRRVHVYRSDVSQESSGLARFSLRPAPGTIVRPGTMAGTLAAVVLGLMLGISALRLWESTGLTPATGALATLLLVVPGGLSAYVGRSQEHPLTSDMLFGLRMVNLLIGFWCFVAAATIVVAQATRADAAAAWLEPCSVGFIVLLVCTTSELFALANLAIAWRRTVRPKERLQLEGRE